MNEPVLDNKNNPSQDKNEVSFANSIFDVFEMFVISLAVVVLIFTFAFRLCNVQGPSMENTLMDSQKLLITDVGYTPARGDIVVFHQTENEKSHYNEPIVKRVIGVAGDTVKVEHFSDSMRVTVTDSDGKVTVLEEDYIRYDYPSYRNSETYVEEGTVFVMGDNRSHSGDSRSDRIGLVDTRRILGKAVFQLGSNVGKPE